ncbi:hypothetical protein E2C01_018425 [Portunus trituberculatus]|uniref:DUF885 domain-containing protein n=1 Tax=Portunus trituberculatus TaxID=210409 RepID=A0A5B7DW43_PORTR|nr:hypothetical protein [Portunus trituberculatus]
MRLWTAAEHTVAAAVVAVVVGLAAIVTSAPPPPPLATPRPDLLALTQDYWHWKTQDYPQFATQDYRTVNSLFLLEIGHSLTADMANALWVGSDVMYVNETMNEYVISFLHFLMVLLLQVGINDNTAGRLDSYSMQHLQQRKAKCEEFLQRAHDIDASSLSPEDLMTLKVFKEEMMTYIQNFPYKKYFAPVTFMAGPQDDFKRMVEKQMVLVSYNDYQKLLSRGYFFGVPPISKPRVRRPNLHSDHGQDSNLPTRALGDPSDPKAHMVPLHHGGPLGSLNSANQYLPATRSEVAASSLPGGEDYYLACLKFFTSTNLTPQEIHNLGLTEVARVEEEVQKTAAEIGMEGKTFSEISEALKTDPVQRFTSKNDLLNTFRNTIYNVIYPRVQEMFPSLPPTNFTVDGDDNPQAIFARYSGPSMDGSRLGSFILNTHSYDVRKKYEVMALSLHETLPGHHLYGAYRQMNPSTPSFRKYIDFTFYTNTPARFPLHTVLSEGWALYSEFLGEELGLYTDPYQK